MSSRPVGTNDDDDQMGAEDPEQRSLASSSKTLNVATNLSLAVLVRDDKNWLSHIRALRETDVIILLTPVVIPISRDIGDTSDPFEKLGRSLSQRHPRVRHIPYTQRNGITSTHIGFIKRGHVVILCFAVQPSQEINRDVAAITIAVNDNKPCIIVVCCSPIVPDYNLSFPTVIQTAGYSPAALEATVKLMFGEDTRPQTSQVSQGSGSSEAGNPRSWKVEEWNRAKDAASVHNLWMQCISPKFIIDQDTLTQLLHRPGYAKHYVVRDPENGHLLGFCATYLSYVDRAGEKLIASLAVMLIPPANRSKGIGLSLHTHGISSLKKTRGVVALQLGSIYPRIFYGPPFDMYINEHWFERRGWKLNSGLAQDLILACDDWPTSVNLPATDNITYQQCTQDKMDEVLLLVEKAAARQSKTGWFDQYWSLMDSPNVRDILIGIENGSIVAAALTYAPGSQVSSNLPWAALIGSEVGGITCVCLCSNQQESTAIGLLTACVQKLKKQGMKRVFMDAVTEGVEDLARLGFKQWAQYRHVWRDV